MWDDRESGAGACVWDVPPPIRAVCVGVVAVLIGCDRGPWRAVVVPDTPPAVMSRGKHGLAQPPVFAWAVLTPGGVPRREPRGSFFSLFHC